MLKKHNTEQIHTHTATCVCGCLHAASFFLHPEHTANTHTRKEEPGSTLTNPCYARKREETGGESRLSCAAHAQEQQSRPSRLGRVSVCVRVRVCAREGVHPTAHLAHVLTQQLPARSSAHSTVHVCSAQAGCARVCSLFCLCASHTRMC